VLALFEDWLRLADHAEQTQGSLTDELKRSVFYTFADQKNLTLLTKAYTLCKLLESSSKFVPEIRRVVAETYDFKTACITAMALGLYDQHFAPDEFAFPLVVEDKSDLTEMWLTQCSRKAQVAAVSWLDNLIKDNTQKARQSSTDARSRVFTSILRSTGVRSS
jgi:hypothetical protein